MKKSILFLFCLGGVAVLEVATITAFCGQVYRCGCSYSEGMTYCNVNSRSEPSCPWCSHGKSGFYMLFGLILAGTALSICLAFRRFGPSLVPGLVAGIMGYLVWGVLVALAFTFYDDYPLLKLWSG